VAAGAGTNRRAVYQLLLLSTCTLLVLTPQEAGKALQSSGINSQTVNEATNVISKTTTTAVSTATPFITKFFQVTHRNRLAYDVRRWAYVADTSSSIQCSSYLHVAVRADAHTMLWSHPHLQFLATADPVTLGEYALGAIVLFYATPAVLGTLGGSFRCAAADTVDNMAAAKDTDIGRIVGGLNVNATLVAQWVCLVRQHCCRRVQVLEAAC
jgi:hypothetical protein